MKNSPPEFFFCRNFMNQPLSRIMNCFNFLFFAFLILISSSANAQNSPPVISNITALADTILHHLTVTFDLSDAENDEMEVFLSASADGGIYFNLNTQNADGDVGFPVSAGTGKRIFWRYADSLSEKVSSFVIRLAADDRFIDIQQIVNQIDTNRLKQNVLFIEGIRHHLTGAQHKQVVRDSLLSRFQQFGLQTREHDFPYGNFTGKNIIGKMTGQVSNTKTYIVDGHYDTVSNSPGADDNASAIAGLLEILRVISENLEFAYSVEFIAFDLEEHGLLGSKAFVANGIMPDEDIAGVINMDMIGYSSNLPNSQTVPVGFDLLFPELHQQLVDSGFKGNFIISTANAPSNSLLKSFENMAAQYVPSLIVGSVPIPQGIILPDAMRSDHAPFWEAGYKALHLSDGAETRNPHYHKPGDVTSTLNFAFMSDVTKAVAATLLSLIKPLHAGIETVQVLPDPASSIDTDIIEKCMMTILPNPNDGKVAVSLHHCGNEPLMLKISSIDGKVIDTRTISAVKNLEMDLRNKLAAGYYFFEISNSSNYLSKKILVR